MSVACDLDDDVDDCSHGSNIGTHKRSHSAVWPHFHRLEPDEHGRRKAICKTCGKQYLADDVSGTSNLLRHLVSHAHNEEQPTGLATVDHEIYRDKVAIAIVKHNYPFQFVEHIGIRELHLFLNSSVKSISRNTAKSNVLKIYRREKEKVKKRAWTCTRPNLFDIWSLVFYHKWWIHVTYSTLCWPELEFTKENSCVSLCTFSS